MENDDFFVTDTLRQAIELKEYQSGCQTCAVLCCCFVISVGNQGKLWYIIIDQDFLYKNS